MVRAHQIKRVAEELLPDDNDVALTCLALAFVVFTSDSTTLALKIATKSFRQVFNEDEKGSSRAIVSNYLPSSRDVIFDYKKGAEWIVTEIVKTLDDPEKTRVNGLVAFFKAGLSGAKLEMQDVEDGYEMTSMSKTSVLT